MLSGLKKSGEDAAIWDGRRKRTCSEKRLPFEVSLGELHGQTEPLFRAVGNYSCDLLEACHFVASVGIVT